MLLTLTREGRTPMDEYGLRRYPTAGIHGRVVHGIGQQIVSGQIEPGELLPRVADLIEEFQASRTAIREAMKVLSTKGLVEARQRAGTRVRPRDDWNLLDPDVLSWQSPETITEIMTKDLVELREVIEPKAARLAAERATPEERERILEAYQRMEEAAGDREAFYVADLAFHLSVFSACHNQLLRRLSGIVGAVLEFSFRLQTESEEVQRDSLTAHYDVYERIARRDPRGAERAMRQVIGRAQFELERPTENTRAKPAKPRRHRKVAKPASRAKTAAAGQKPRTRKSTPAKGRTASRRRGRPKSK